MPEEKPSTMHIPILGEKTEAENFLKPSPIGASVPEILKLKRLLKVRAAHQRYRSLQIIAFFP